MTVSVNQVQRPDSDLDQLVKAISLATNIYGVKLDKDRQTKLDEIQAKKTAAEATQLALQNKRAEQQDTRNFAKDFVAVPADSDVARKFGIEGIEAPSSFKIPEGSTLAPRSAVEADRLERAQILAARKAEAAANKAAKKDEVTRENSLSDDYKKASKETILAVSGYKKLEAAATNPNPTGATDLALIFGFMKSIDPGSTVREGEFANAENAQGVPTQYRNLYNKIIEGARLDPETRTEFLNEGKRALSAQLETQKFVDDEFADRATRFGIDPGYVVSKQFEQLRQSIGSSGGGGTNQAALVLQAKKIARSEGIKDNDPNFSATVKKIFEGLQSKGNQSQTGTAGR